MVQFAISLLDQYENRGNVHKSFNKLIRELLLFKLEPIDNGSYGGGGDNREQFGQGMTTAQIPMEQNGRNMMSSRGVDGPSISLRSVSGQYKLITAEYPLLIDSFYYSWLLLGGQRTQPTQLVQTSVQYHPQTTRRR